MDNSIAPYILFFDRIECTLNAAYLGLIVCQYYLINILYTADHYFMKWFISPNIWHTLGYIFITLGDTLYATDHGLIDWYPQSKCLK